MSLKKKRRSAVLSKRTKKTQAAARDRKTLKQRNDAATAKIRLQRDALAVCESEERFRRMADHAPMMVWTSGIDKSCSWLNRPWLDFTGRTLEQHLGDGWLEAVHLDDRTQCFKTYAASFDARLPFTMEYRLRRRDSEWRWVLDSGTPHYNEDHTFVGYIGSVIDITERRRADAALREGEERLRAILNTVKDGIITIDNRGIIVGVNPAAERIFGYAQDTLLGESINLLVPQAYQEDTGSLAKHLQSAHAHTAGIPVETVGLRKDSSVFPLELRLTEIPDIGLFTGIYRDISARKQNEHQMYQYRMDLKTMASELMLAEARERQRLAEDLHDGVGQGLFRAHLKLTQLPTAAEPAVTEISAILQEVSTMVSRMTFKLSPPVLHKVGLQAAVRSLAKDMHQQYALSVEIDDDTQDIQIDERVALILYRSVRELLINVAKHAQTDRAYVSLKIADARLQVEVADCGKGFHPDDQSRHVESGHFGLFSVRERLEYIGGTFKICSTPGRGTTVTLTATLASGRVSGARVLKAR